MPNVAPVHHAMREWGLDTTTGSQNDAAASAAAHYGDDNMPEFNWRSLDDTYYDQIEKAEMTGIAWECLRRNASFEQDYQAISSSDRSIGHGFRQHWGLVFRSRPRAILYRADYLLGPRGRSDDYTSASYLARQIRFVRQSGPEQHWRESISARSGRLARGAQFAWRRTPNLVQRGANPRRNLPCRIAAG